MTILLSCLGLLLAACSASTVWGGRWRQRARYGQTRGGPEENRPDERLATCEAQLGEARNRADALHQELASLSYAISHDLRAPLRGIGGFAQALLEDYGTTLDLTAQDYLRRVCAGAGTMNEMIEQLLGLSRVAAAGFHPEPVDLSEVARDLSARLDARDPVRRTVWSIQPSIFAYGDKPLLVNALGHLMENAWKFSANRATAHLSFGIRQGEDGESVYQVGDDGVGFDMQYAGKLFGAFQRLHGRDEFPGHGLGLAVVQRIVRRHGGEVWIDSRCDGGTTVSFKLGAAPRSTRTGLQPVEIGLPLLTASPDPQQTGVRPATAA